MTNVPNITTPSMLCDLCGCDSIEIISHADRHQQALDTGLCLGCGLVMHVPVPSEAEVNEYYASRYRQDYHGESQPSERRIMRAWKNAERIHRQLSPSLSHVNTVFEVGAGIGCTVKLFETEGFQASGIEPNHDFNAFTQQSLFAQVENTNLFDLEASARTDLLLLIHVIEHFSSPQKALRHLRGLIHDDGLFYVECPNVTGPFATYDRMFHYAHIYNFTPQTLQAMVEQCGFELLECFSDDTDPDIHMLFKKCAVPESAVVKAEHADWVRDRIKQFNVISYHARPSYLSKRVRKVSSYLMEYMQAKDFVSALLSRLGKS
jgi:SAM-dependent methyltransferase